VSESGEPAPGVRVRADVCIGSGECARTVPEVFGQLDDGSVELREQRPGPALRDRVRQAAARCPSGAIEAG
jgi:ferredoxin